MDDIEIIETGIDGYQSDEKASIDIQVATAKRYPRDIRRSTDDAIAVATMDKQTAETCNYSLPRSGKSISGPSVHLARIIAQEWGNLRVESKIIEITNTQIVSQAICFDLQKNYAVKVQVRKNIIYSSGKRFNDDMITVTGNAINAISFRNSVFSVIPKSVTDKVYNAAKNMITGDLSTEEKLIKRRKQIFDKFFENYKVTEEQLIEVLGLNSINQVKQDQIVILIGLAQAIKDGDTTVAETFSGKKKNEKVDEAADKLKEIKLRKAEKEESPTDFQQMKFKTEDEARLFFVNDNGYMPESVAGNALYETAKESGIELIIQIKKGIDKKNELANNQNKTNPTLL